MPAGDRNVVAARTIDGATVPCRPCKNIEMALPGGGQTCPHIPRTAMRTRPLKDAQIPAVGSRGERARTPGTAVLFHPYDNVEMSVPSYCATRLGVPWRPAFPEPLHETKAPGRGGCTARLRTEVTPEVPCPLQRSSWWPPRAAADSVRVSQGHPLYFAHWRSWRWFPSAAVRYLVSCFVPWAAVLLEPIEDTQGTLCRSLEARSRMPGTAVISGTPQQV